MQSSRLTDSPQQAPDKRYYHCFESKATTSWWLCDKPFHCFESPFPHLPYLPPTAASGLQKETLQLPSKILDVKGLCNGGKVLSPPWAFIFLTAKWRDVLVDFERHSNHGKQIFVHFKFVTSKGLYL